MPPKAKSGPQQQAQRYEQLSMNKPRSRLLEAKLAPSTLLNLPRPKEKRPDVDFLPKQGRRKRIDYICSVCSVSKGPEPIYEGCTAR